MNKRKKQVTAIIGIALLLCGCSSKKEEAEVSSTSSTPTPAASASASSSAYSADNFTLTVTDTSENGLKTPLKSIQVTDPDGNVLDLEMSNTNQRTTYTCSDYSLSISYSLLTDGVEEKTTVKYLLEVTDNTSSRATQSSRIQEEIFNCLPDTEWYEDGSAMVNKTEDSSALAEETEDREDRNIDIDVDESELGTSTTDGTVCVCDACGKEFATTTLWYQHVMEAHEGGASYHIESK